MTSLPGRDSARPPSNKRHWNIFSKAKRQEQMSNFAAKDSATYEAYKNQGH